MFKALSPISRRSSLIANFAPVFRIPQARNYTLILAPKHTLPKTWSTFEEKLNVEYIEKYNDEMFDFLGLDPQTIDFTVNEELLSGLPVYRGNRIETDQILVEYLADKADAVSKLDPNTLTPFSTDYIVRTMFYHVSTRYFYDEIGSKSTPFVKPVTVPLWLLTSKRVPGDVDGTDVRHFKDRHEHVRPDITLEKVFAHTIHRYDFSEEDRLYLRQQMMQLVESVARMNREKSEQTEESGEISSQFEWTEAKIQELDKKISSLGLITFADVTDLAYDNIPDTFDFGRMRSIINYGTYNINPVMPMMTVTGSLVKFSLGLFGEEYCEACTQVAQHVPPKVRGKVIGFCGSDDPNGWNILKKEEREEAFKYIIALKKFASLPLKEMKTVKEAMKLL